MTDSHASKPSDTKTRILDVAEALFASNGFRQTSISRLARAAGVNLAAVNYHFGSKDALIRQVIERRLLPVHRLRVQRLEAVRETCTAQGLRPDVAELLRAFVEPSFSLTRGGDGGQRFLLIIGRVMAESDESIRNIFIRSFKPSFMLFFSLMRKSLPGLPKNELFWRLHFVASALGHAMRVHGAAMPSSELFPPKSDVDTVVRILMAFLTAGLKAPSHRESTACPPE
ncbi:TetR/AcrR family transcriptional regulator [Desulfosarcina ovata]|uniref:TetR family transcriptional regulator n=1 Tax=Desulfosarcina ovata subsp. ovata TaxID=2752305 RepID=A0A5K8A448_9BACT|nr:TetR family transcriptional regulator [Desulfosarcina ovata]BBO87251.1 TetR family transcriptional regulator [Desulfosarcina ovata subsp. ovata]